MLKFYCNIESLGKFDPYTWISISINFFKMYAKFSLH